MPSQTSLDQVQKIYIAYYGRPADAAGLSYWAQALDAAGGDLHNIIDAFANSAESNALYGPLTTTEARVALPARSVIMGVIPPPPWPAPCWPRSLATPTP